MSGGPPDVVIPVRPGDRNEELRYALRSIAANLPHRRVWLAGHAPRWTSGVGHVPAIQNRSKYENSTRNLLAACRHPEVSEEFYLWNDDFILMAPLPGGVQPLHRGTARGMLAEAGKPYSAYYLGLATTIKILAQLGHPEPLCYELHVPMPMTKSGVVRSWAAGTARGMPRVQALHKRTLYGNLEGVGGTEAGDVKVFKLGQEWSLDPRAPFLSTTDDLWGRHPATREAMDMFPEPGLYEGPRK